MESNGETKMNEAREKKKALLNANVFFFGAFFYRHFSQSSSSSVPVLHFNF